MDKDQQSIEAFLGGTMTSEESQAFEQRLTQEPELSGAYRNELTARELIKEAGRLELKNTLEDFDAQMQTTTAPKRIIPLWAKNAMRVAALLILFVGVYQVFLTFGGVNTSEVYDTYFEAYEAPSLERDATGTVIPIWEQAVASYRNEAYKEAIPYFEKSKGEVPDYLIAFYVGMSEMSQKEPNWEQAVEHFDEVLSIDNDYRQQAEWYKALALLQLEKEEAAITIFKRIVAAKSYQHEQAASILKLDIK